jgi:hypothetical protein
MALVLIVVLALLGGCRKKQDSTANTQNSTPVNKDFNPNVSPVGGEPAPNFVNHAQHAVDKIQIPQAPLSDPAYEKKE